MKRKRELVNEWDKQAATVVSKFLSQKRIHVAPNKKERILKEVKRRFKRPSLKAAQMIVGMSDVAFYNSVLLKTLSKVTGNKRPLSIVPWKKAPMSKSAMLKSIYTKGSVYPVGFILVLNMAIHAANGFLDNMPITNKWELLFWSIQHELLHTIGRIMHPNTPQGQHDHCDSLLYSWGQDKYGEQYIWGPCKSSHQIEGCKANNSQKKMRKK